MHLRRTAAAALAAFSTLLIAASPSPSPAAAPAALYGDADPTYDGVWRQSYALLALHAADTEPAGDAVKWLAGQQCADGGFASYRADPTAPCDPKTEDTNATALAVQALAVHGQDFPVKRAAEWLAKVQNRDGGWSYNPGGASDADSTGVVIGGLKAAGADVKSVTTDGLSPYDALRSLQLACGKKDGGAFAYQPDPTSGDLAANAKATADAVRGAEGAGLVVEAPGRDVPVRDGCGGGASDAGAAWLAARLTAGGGHFDAVTPGSDEKTPDFGTTADAVVALSAGGHLDAAKGAYNWLAANSGAWAKDNPTALAQLSLAAYATGNPMRDHITRLSALGPVEQQKPDSSGGGSVWWIVGACLVAGIGIGVLLAGRKHRL
ncbi:prenyltransferase/squalene oxidase repeat-containing protein [Actinacidiphila glaucinigra]|uniref:Prenyltransferase and squalene oxidase repeat-containing protein n=1 Tax=Actinacidiphila glaucinigra TaxID=235986 RepID=A0A238ZE81_9ACTN|nr:prenyltransferase/squalene oxidase repeat-containing protein [Actinacidiphila glaucinigra]SNR81826.1 Prenyltransferase and squalene oxidase repeat-containing protein [Actinacidiphila glaucinigra]